MKINRRILDLAIPNIISNITIPLVGMVGMAIAGRLGSDTAIGGLAIGTSLFNLVYWNFVFLRMGTSGLVAQAYGGRNFGEITAVLVRSLFMALVIASFLLIFQRGIGQLLFGLMNGTSEAMAASKEYFYARIWAAPATLSIYAFQGWFIGMQNSRFPMYIAIVVNGLNVIFDIWFALWLGWGIAGIGWGAVVAQYGGLSLAVVLWLLYYRRFLGRVDLGESIDLRPLLKFLSVNRDIFLRTLCLVAVYTFFTSASSTMGDTLLATNSLLLQLFTLFSFMMDGFAYAAESLVGRWVGAGNPQMAQRYLKYLLGWSAGVALVSVGVYLFAWQDILSLFTDSEAILSAAGDYIFWMMLIPLAGFMPFLVDGALVGATRTTIMRNNIFFSALGYFIVYYSLRGVLGNNALWLAFVTFLALRGVLLYFQTGGLRIAGKAGKAAY